MPNTLCVVPESLGLARTSPPRSTIRTSLNSLATQARKPSKVRLSMKLRLVTNARMPFSSSRSAAQRKKRAYMSYTLVFCAVLSAM